MSSGSSIGSPMMSAVVAVHFRAGRVDGRRRCSQPGAQRSLCSGDLCASCPGSFSGGSSVKVVGVRVVGDAGRLSRPLSRRTRRRRRRCSRARDRRRLHDPLGHPFPTITREGSRRGLGGVSAATDLDQNPRTSRRPLRDPSRFFTILYNSGVFVVSSSRSARLTAHEHHRSADCE